MNRIFLIVGLIFLNTFCFAQGEKRIKFSTCFKEANAGEGTLIITGIIEKDFHIFAADPGGDGTQIPTEVTITKNAFIQPLGKIVEQGKLITEQPEGLDFKINYYKNEIKYEQKIKFKAKVKGAAKIYFQICNESMCERPAEVNIPFDLSVNCDGTGAKKDTVLKAKDTSTNKIALNNTGNNLDTTSKVANTESNIPIDPNEKTYGMFGKIVGDCGVAQQEKLNPWLAFLYGILGGLAGLFFPCTLPMIPMTISFFLKGNSNKKEGIKKGIWYGLSIFLVYFLLSLPFLLFNVSRDSLSNLATNVPMNLVYFAVFMAFAFSLFGFYDISLPSGLASKVDSKSNTKDLPGIFFMALTLAIVSFSCTGPILGLVLGNLKQPELITPAMSGFGLGLGLPFALFAMFPNLLKAMPKSGSWLTTLKVVFGFIEVAFALKFLSNADLVKQWGFLKRETFMGLWILITIMLALYLLGKFSPKKGYENNPVGMPSKIMALLCIVFAGYLSLDFIGKDPKLVSGFPPPSFYSYLHKEEKLANGTAAKTHKLKDITVYLNLEDAIAEGKKQNKPVMIDFTGWACVNCRKMEENVWTKPEINGLLKDKFILASLYVDDKRPLLEQEQFESAVLQKKATSVGDKWFDLSLKHFQSASQPFYALIDPNQPRILNTPVAYTPDVKDYAAFLNCGLTNFENLHK